MSQERQIYVHIRCMIRKDWFRVLLIEDQYPHAWSEDAFKTMLANRNTIGMVAEIDDLVVGFMIYTLEQGLIEVENFAVDSERMRTGIGKAMMQRLIGKLNPERRRCINLVVRESNFGMQSFLKAIGFRASRVYRGYYDDTREDGYLFQYRVKDEAELIQQPSERRNIFLQG